MNSALKVVEDIANQTGQSTVDILQQLLEKEMDKRVAGKVSVRFLLDGGFEGDFWIEIKSVQVRGDKDCLKIVIDGINGEMELELKMEFKG